ncbi:MAG: hypothetical protein D6714_06415 [Bacteroidetes bacterium]|nr:MAG: hypothetical protein D6714_06415 [Bacteroidota bacterium]
MGWEKLSGLLGCIRPTWLPARALSLFETRPGTGAVNKNLRQALKARRTLHFSPKKLNLPCLK